MPSLFTRIVTGEIPAHEVFRAERWIGILDLFPVAPGHLLLIPTQETALAQDLPAATLADLGGLIARATACLRGALDCDAVSVLLRDGEAAGQEIPHLHVHCIPRNEGDAAHQFRGGRYGEDDDSVEAAMRAMAERLRSCW